MGKLFHEKDKYTHEEYDNEEVDYDELSDEEVDLEDEIEEIEEIEEPEDNVIEDENDSENEDDSEDEEDEEDSEDENDVESEEDDEDDRRLYRKRRRVRNQIIVYSIVLVIMSVIVAGGVVVGKNIAGTIKEKRMAEEQARMLEQLRAEQEAEAAHEIVIDAPEALNLEPEVDPLEELIDSSIISVMPLEDKVAGIFIVTPEALTGVRTVTQAGEETQEALNEYAVGGFIYFDHNIVDEEQLKALISGTTSKSRYPLFQAVDEEGGSVSRVAGSSIEVIQVGDMAAIGESGDTAQAFEAGLTIGTYLKNLGFNLDFAPVADVAGDGNSAMGDRVFGSDAQLVSDMVSNVVDGIEGTGVSACLKHFPGIGYAKDDTHDGRVEATKTLEEMRSTDFIPFKVGIDAGVDFVMVSHITVTDAEEDAVPSSLSKKMITDILRNELGFEGVVITDALDMGAITEYYTTEEAAVMAVTAGADVLLMPDDFNAAYDAVLAAVQDGTISEERIDESLRRIYRVKWADKLD